MSSFSKNNKLSEEQVEVFNGSGIESLEEKKSVRKITEELQNMGVDADIISGRKNLESET
ncbi:hypothetical protein [Evansella clarkii]|jgi:SOS response regulatory protein OraA/RecX|uniref:hypothetical protein n=1 Tax=Evansella clarkii TaxID=79879 RepID=UPI0009987C4F|nr:hypothetical protein [Evansella clarkii]